MKAQVPARSEHDDPEAVSVCLVALNNPRTPLIEAVRSAILAADRLITEGIKWNAPSFYCHGWFATVNLRAKAGIQLILHHGAKSQAESTLSSTIEDSSGLLTWLGKDRASITFLDAEDYRKKSSAFTKIIQQWAKYQASLSLSRRS